MRIRWFLVVAASALVVGLVVGLLVLRDDGPSDEARTTATTTSSTSTTSTTAPPVLTSDGVLTAALRSASQRLTGRAPSREDTSAFVAQYHQDEAEGAATTPATAADAYVRLHHPSEVTAYRYVRGAKCFGERLIPGGDDADCDTTTTAR
jgi:hypothetical protein